ncbi:unnamed protein product [Spirodela intermedia]|uniref:Protein cereblon n=1 Tax=Spirodela intermedia TaxID=51605 RepID=A0A7I8J9C1_SPIIN|nr:unnamed protein product [Spirodela intermedia]CAA6666052.1 unnamed protein product [Spirodela intermedia]
MDEERLLENERLQIQLIRELDMEELEVEEVDGHHDLSSDDESDSPDAASGSYVAFNTSLASLHTYLGEVDDTYGRMTSLDGGEILTLPMFDLEGVVLFPDATLPLRVIQPRLISAVERAMTQTDSCYTIAVVRIVRQSVSERFHFGRPNFARIGTTAEIRQFKRLEDGSLNVVARGQQRFHLRRCWIDADLVPCAELQIINEDEPLRTPRDAFAQLASVANPSHGHRISHALPSEASPGKCQDDDEENDWERTYDMSPLCDHSARDMRTRLSLIDSPSEYGVSEYCTSSDDDFEQERKQRLKSCQRDSPDELYQQQKHGRMCDSGGTIPLVRKESLPCKISTMREGQERCWAINGTKRSYQAPLSFWSHWVYRMYDSFALARRAADMWKQIIGAPSMDSLVKKPGLLSFHIASRLPLSESTRQELLEMHGISYRLQKEIQLLERFDRVRCKSCLTLIGKRRDMVVMSADGPLNAYANPGGYVHEIMTLTRASGLALEGSPVKEHSWFPGYAWTIAKCAACESYMGWLFTAARPRLRPKSFWGIRSSQVLDDTADPRHD